MNLSRFSVPLFALFAAVSSAQSGDPLLDELVRAKTAYRAHDYTVAEEALAKLKTLADEPRFAPVRDKILPPYHFYAAAVAFDRGRQTETDEHLDEYLIAVPGATADPALYPKKFVDRLEERKKRLASEGERAAFDALGPADPSLVPLNTGAADWHGGAVRFLLTDEEKSRFAGLADDEERRRFISEFWSSLDPSPGTAVNEYQIEFYRRAKFADSNWSTETMKGSESDRGMVLVLLGPPSYRTLGRYSDSEDVQTALRERRPTFNAAGQRGTVSAGPVVNPGNFAGSVEQWVYRGDKMPQGLPGRELKLKFLTKEGYGNGVLVKDQKELMVLRSAMKQTRKM